jgi:hypothetical protein
MLILAWICPSSMLYLVKCKKKGVVERGRIIVYSRQEKGYNQNKEENC